MKSSSKDAALRQLQTQLQLRSLRPNTVETYMQRARQFLEAVDKEPAEVTRRDVECYLLELRDAGRAEATRNLSLVSIRTLLTATTDRDVTETIPRAKEPRTMTVADRHGGGATVGGHRVAEVPCHLHDHLRGGAADRRGAPSACRRHRQSSRPDPRPVRQDRGALRATGAPRAHRLARRLPGVPSGGPELFPGGHRGKRKGTVLVAMRSAKR